MSDRQMSDKIFHFEDWSGVHEWNVLCHPLFSMLTIDLVLSIIGVAVSLNFCHFKKGPKSGEKQLSKATHRQLFYTASCLVS